jgi:hypothetical protein
MTAARRTCFIPPLCGNSSQLNNPNATTDDYWNDVNVMNLLPVDSDQLQTPPYADRGSSSSSGQRMQLAAAGVNNRPPWHSGVIARLPCAGLASLFGIFLREFDIFPWHLCCVARPHEGRTVSLNFTSSFATNIEGFIQQLPEHRYVYSGRATTCPSGNGGRESGLHRLCELRLAPSSPTACYVSPSLKGWQCIFGGEPSAEQRFASALSPAHQRHLFPFTYVRCFPTIIQCG